MFWVIQNQHARQIACSFGKRSPNEKQKLRQKKGGKKERNHKVVRSRFVLTTLNTVTFSQIMMFGFIASL